MLPTPPRRYLGTHWGTYEANYTEQRLTELLPIAEDPDPSPIAQGMIVAQDAPSRIERPALRAGFLERVRNGSAPEAQTGERGRDTFVELPWEEALDIAALEIDRVIRTYGNHAIFGGSYGWASAGRFHHAQSQVHRFLNGIGGYTRSVQNYSYAAADVIVPHVIGDKRGLVSGHTPLHRIAQETDTLLLFGGLPHKNAQVSSGGISRHILRDFLDEVSARDARIVSVSPISDDTECAGVEWLPIRPGTDTALMLGIAHVLISEGLHDKGFLSTHTVGFERLEAYVLGHGDNVPKTASWAASITDIPETDIVALARTLAATRSFIMVAWSLQRARFGEQPYWMAIALAAMLGQIGLPGGGFGFGYGSTNGVGFPNRNTGMPALSQLSNPVADFIPVARIADCLAHPGETYDYNGQTRTYPDLRLIYWAGGNPFHHHQDLNRFHDLWQRPETIIVNESFWTATARRADIVFPVATALERNDIVAAGRDSFITPSHALRPPFADSRTDYEIFAALAERLGTIAGFTEGRDEEAWLRTMYDAALSSHSSGAALPPFDEFWKGGPFILEPTEETRNAELFAEFRRDPERAALETPSGKIELYSETIAAFGYDDCPGHPVWLEPDEWLGSDRGTAYPLHLISNQPKSKLHSQYDAGPHARADKIQGRERLRLNPADAQSRGLIDGQVVKIFNHRGACLAGLEVSEAIRPGVVQLSTGAWFDPDYSDAHRLCRHGNPNVLTKDMPTSRLSQGVAAMTCLVEVEAFEGPLPPITVFERPSIDSSRIYKEEK
ncbi:molybdopterin-dependent oxidoreductase [Algicella marina]|uniref:Molybdopterin-dependent oxidoreductase n=1 Tax=Algicella marina TaxID=2683284 RepID=A0A6P1T0T4_9RHOB|nr:molybdopterin-dependent oxidoreductase [Algicella marina]QHQ35430.1 molybdopterin-dependent oxidoreductase [Algicella marina]